LVTRLRTDGGPSHELLVLLDQHRVLTSGQLARLTGAPLRTVTYRLDRLLQARLVAFARPGREAGSSPRFWWLTPYGARLVAGVAPAEGKRPSAMFAGHVSAIAEAWLAVLERGPAAGVTGTGWWPDRAGWHTWRRGGADVTLSPDAILAATLSRTAAGQPAGPAGQPGGARPDRHPTVAFVEIDLATMSQSKLREKVSRYLAYAEDREWQDRWPHCPPLLLLTTTQARAITFLRAAARVAAAARRGRGLDYRFRGYGRAGADVAEAERLVIAACGHVRKPQAAITGRVWLTAPAEPDDEPAAIALAELLGERVAAQQVADRWYARIEADHAATHRAAQLAELARGSVLAEQLGDPVAAAAYAQLAGDVDAFSAGHPQLAEQVLTWWEHGDQPGDDGRREDLRVALRAEHERLLAEQARAVLAAPRTAAGDPRAAAAAAALQSGRLLPAWLLDGLGGPVTETREQLQQRLLAEHTARRDDELADRYQALSRWARRRADPVADAAAYDETQLLVCDLCAIAVPADTGDQWWTDDDDRPQCRQCGTGRLIAYTRRGQTPTLDERLTQLRARFAATPPAAANP
jgi:DNA-binding transcriptional ArsR family regulator